MSSLIAIPESAPPRVKRGLPWLLVVVPMALLLAGGGGWMALRAWRQGASPAVSGKFFDVAPMNMDVTITKDGELQAVHNTDIVCPLEGLNTVVSVVKEGATVKKGDVLVMLDTSDIMRKKDDADLEMKKADSDLTAATEQQQIQESTNAANLEAADVELTLARLDLQAYVEGVYPQLLSEAQRNVEMAQIGLKNKEDDLGQTKQLFTKGFVTAADVKKAELDVLTAQNDLEKKNTDLAVMTKYTHEKDLTDKKNKVAQAENKVARTRKENASNLTQKVNDAQNKAAALMLRTRLVDHLQEQLDACTIKAPTDGMVLYVQNRSRDQPLQTGTQVRQQELLLRLPDVSAMKAVVRIQEGQVSKLYGKLNKESAQGQEPEKIRAMVNIVGYPMPMGATVSNISVMPDNSMRWWNPDLKEYPVDLVLDETPAGLKPGVGVQPAKIFIERLNDVLAVPLQAVYTTGPTSYVFVRSDNDVRPVKVTIGQSNETHVEIRDGIASGDHALLLESGQGRDLLERFGIKAAPASRPSNGT